MAEPKVFVWEELVREVVDGGESSPYLQLAHGDFDMDRHRLRVAVPNDFARRKVEREFGTRLVDRLKQWFPGVPCDVDIVVDKSLSVDYDSVSAADDVPVLSRTGAGRAHQDDETELNAGPARPSGNDGSGLNPAYRFDHFVIGSSNRLAHAASLGVAEQPDGRHVNPLFIYGGVGLGKTHLLQAIGNLIRVRRPQLKVLYVSAETFTNDMVEAIRHQETSLIRNKYRTMDVLLMDDVQFLQRKEQTQIEFFYTFNDLHNANKQIVLASDSNPKDMSELEERVRSRFMWGMITRIDQPEFETRTVILERKAEQLGVDALPADVAAYIAERITTNIRELEGTLTTICRMAEEAGRAVDMSIAHEVLGGDGSDAHAGDGLVSTAAIQRLVADYYQLRATDLKAKRRTQRLAMARHVAMYLCRQFTDLPLVEIGREFGGRDHSTVISACAKIERQVEHDARLQQALGVLTERIREFNAVGR